MRSPLRIAILEAGYPTEGTALKYGSYGGVFSSFLKAGVEKLDAPGFPAEEGLEITKWDVHNPDLYPSLDDVDGILITGSQSNAFDNIPWINKLVEFTRKVLTEQNRVRIMGFCFGHQIIGRALGAKVDRNEHGWEASVVPVQMSPKGKKLFDGKDILNLHQMHRDVITELPVGVELLGSTSVCKIQGMYASKRLLTLQGHPEFTCEIVSDLLILRKNIGIFPEDMFKEMISRADNEHDGVVVAVAILKFLNE